MWASKREGFGVGVCELWGLFLGEIFLMSFKILIIDPSYRYTQVIALSLFLFNLLPLPLTDGSQLLEALTEWSPTERPMRPLTAKSMQATLNTPQSRELEEAEAYELTSDDEGAIGLKGDPSGDTRTREKPKVARWKRFLRITVQVYMVAVCVMWVIGWGMILLLQSS